MAERCEWCGAEGAEQTFEAPWRERHFKGPAATVTWHVCDKRCEARLGKHLDATMRAGYDKWYRVFAKWWFWAQVLVFLGLPLAGLGLATWAGVSERSRSGVWMGSLAMALGATHAVRLLCVPIWLDVPKPSSASGWRVSLRTAEWLSRLYGVLWLFAAGGLGGLFLWMAAS